MTVGADEELGTSDGWVLGITLSEGGFDGIVEGDELVEGRPEG